MKSQQRAAATRCKAGKVEPLLLTGAEQASQSSQRCPHNARYSRGAARELTDPCRESIWLPLRRRVRAEETTACRQVTAINILRHGNPSPGISMIHQPGRRTAGLWKSASDHVPASAAPPPVPGADSRRAVGAARIRCRRRVCTAAASWGGAGSQTRGQPTRRLGAARSSSAGGPIARLIP